MGTWDATPFGNDTAADYARNLDELTVDERPSAIRKALAAAAGKEGYLDDVEGVRAIAAAALVAAQRPNGRPVDAIYGPREPVPALPEELRPLAVAALDRVVGADSELQELWDESSSNQEWHAEIDRLRKVLSVE